MSGTGCYAGGTSSGEGGTGNYMAGMSKTMVLVNKLLWFFSMCPFRLYYFITW